MAKRRMFSLDIIDTDLFMEMPQTSRLLYYELCMRADDDGFVSSPKKIMKMVGCNEDDFRVLTTKQFIIPFDTGIVVIKHWKIHNYIQKDRYKETIYLDEKTQLEQEKNGMYTRCIQDGYTGKVRLELGKDRLGQDKDDDHDNDTLIDFIETNFGRTLNPIEVELIMQWEDNDLTRYAIKQAILNGAYNFKYINTILNSYKMNNITTVQQAQEENERFLNKKNNVKENKPDWFNKEVIDNTPSDDEINSLEERLKKYK